MKDFVKSKGIIYYTDNRLREPIFSVVQNQLLKVDLPIVSCSLKPISFGQNIVLELRPGITTMAKQILEALEKSTADIIFFCEHDVLYHPSHFDFVPLSNETFYYNVNNWRWDYPYDHFVTYKHLRSLSGLCVYREFAINHYKKRLKLIKERGYTDSSREPKWSMKIGHEPGRKVKIGGISDDFVIEWKSKYPNIDIRHGKTITRRKCRLVDFFKPPKNWLETTMNKIPDWNLKELFNL
jgi:hypothetical protein